MSEALAASIDSDEVGGTVDSQARPETAPNAIADNGVTGNEMKASVATARVK